MSPETKKRVCGNFCVVVHTDGTSEVKIVEEGKDIFAKAKELIGCRYLDHVIVQTLQKGGRDCIEFLVNDAGYFDYGRDPSKINQIATLLYSHGNAIDHYILGDVVICLMVDGEDGGEFEGLSYGLAMDIARQNNEQFKQIALEKVPRPNVVPEPVVKVSSYADIDDMFKAMRGDETVKPTSETIILGSVNGETKA